MINKHFLLTIILILYLIIDFKLPNNILLFVDTFLGKIIIIFSVLILFIYDLINGNTILGILSLLIAYQILTQTVNDKYNYLTEYKKWSPYSQINKYPYTLEQEMVKKMTKERYNTNYIEASYRPILNDTYDATSIL